MTRKSFFAALAMALVASGCATLAAGPADLAGTSWQITTIDDTPAAEGSMLAFTADSISASAGCNRLGGVYTVVGDKLVAGPLVSTRMYCDGRMEHEATLGALLQDGATISVEGDRLMLDGTSHELLAVRQP